MDDQLKTIQEFATENDILKKRIRELEISETERMLASIVKLTRDPVILTTPDGSMIYLNEAGKGMLGLSEADIAHTNIVDVVSNGFKNKAHQEILPSIESVGYWEGDLQYQNLKTGSLTDVHAVTFRIIDPETGALQYYAYVSHDITERKKSEEALRKRESLIRSMFEADPTGVSLTVARVIKKANKRFCEITGYQEHELLEKNTRLLYSDESEYNRVGKILYDDLKANGIGNIESRWKRKDGIIIDVFLSMSPLDPMDWTAGLTSVVVDISNFKEVQAELIAKSNHLALSQQQLRAILQASPIAIGRIRERTLEWANEAMCKITGYKVEEILGMNSLPLYESEAEYNRVGEIIYREGAIETKWVRKDGEVRNISIQISQMSSFAYIFTAMDITEQKRAEQLLRDSEQLYRAIFENTGTASIIIEEDTTIALANTEWVNLAGYSREEMERKMSWTQFVVPEDLDRMQDYHKRRRTELNEAPRKYEFRFIRRNGEFRDMINCVGMLPGSRRSIASLMDISESKRAGTALQESEAKYRQLVENINQGVLVAQDGMLKFVNPMCIKVMGYSEQELTDRPFIEFVHSDDRKMILERHIKRMGGERVPSSYEFRIIAYDGSTRWIEVDSVEIHWERKLAALAFLSDITGRKNLELQLLQAQKMEAIGTLSGGIAHDFNNILGAMIGYTELSMMEQDEGRRQRNLKQVLQACERATSLVSQILTFSRKSDVDKKPANIVHIVKEALALLRASIPTTIEIRQNIDPGYMVALANHTQIHQIMINLCTNAAHAMRKNGGILEIKLKPLVIAADSPLISLELRPGSYLKLEISDTGHGIDQANLNRIFDPFFTTKEISEGTGLGLSVVYGIVKSHNGTITVDSILGSGSTFTVYLPALQHQETKEEVEEEIIRHGNERILFVDDEPMIAALGSEMLRKSGYKVTDTTDSAQALEMFAETPDAYDLVITDMTMPCMTGIDLAKDIWAIRPDTPVILCTGHSNAIDEDQAKEEGVRRFIMKPLRYKELSKAVRDVLDEKRTPFEM